VRERDKGMKRVRRERERENIYRERHGERGEEIDREREGYNRDRKIWRTA
jgi:hypothetical protein